MSQKVKLLRINRSLGFVILIRTIDKSHYDSFYYIESYNYG